ncbi:2-keto-4-pentenoate hydratase (MhpD) [Fructobacillus fructosus]|nr:2-keto-4-pentenoate hydratase (MhpD) [Fructobacillus fructosus]
MTEKQMTKKGMELAKALYEAYKTQKPLQMADWTGVVTTDDEAY